MTGLRKSSRFRFRKSKKSNPEKVFTGPATAAAAIG